MADTNKISQSLNSSGSQNESRIAVNKDLLDAAEDVINEKFSKSGDVLNSISKSAIVEIALLQLLDQNDKKLITTNLTDNKLNNAIKKVVFGQSSLNDGDVSQKIEPIYEYTKKQDASRKSMERVLMAIFYTQVLQLRLQAGQTDFDFDEELSETNFSTLMDLMYRAQTTTWADDIQLNTINVSNRKNRNKKTK